MKLAEIKVSYCTPPGTKIKLSDSNQVYDFIMNNWDLDIIEFQEETKVILLNRANNVLGIYPLSKGGISGTVVDIRIVLSVALKCHATGLILVHNHPSGNLVPSSADKDITKKLKDACAILEISLIDHLIIAKSGYFSFSNEGEL